MRNRSYRGRERRENWDKELGRRKGRDKVGEKYDGKRERGNDCRYGVTDGSAFSISVLSETKIATVLSMWKTNEICFSQNLFARQGFHWCLSREFSIGQKRKCFCFKKCVLE